MFSKNNYLGSTTPLTPVLTPFLLFAPLFSAPKNLTMFRLINRYPITGKLINKGCVRFFSVSKTLAASENPAAERASRLQSFLEQIRSNEKIREQLKSVQLVIASKIDTTSNEPPSLMQQLALMSDTEVRKEMVKLSEVMKEENVNISKEDVGWLMQAFKAQMGEGDGQSGNEDEKK